MPAVCPAQVRVGRCAGPSPRREAADGEPDPDRPARTRVLLAALLAVALLAGGAGWWVVRDDGSAADVAAGLGSTGRRGLLPRRRAGDPRRRARQPHLVAGGGRDRPRGARTHLVLYRSVGAKGSPSRSPGPSPCRPASRRRAAGRSSRGARHDGDGRHVRALAHHAAGPGPLLHEPDPAGARHLPPARIRRRRQRLRGLGTPGPHPYLLGESAGRAMTDIVSAARELDDRVSGTWLAAGHSQGGQAALFTAQSVDGYARTSTCRASRRSLRPRSCAGPSRPRSGTTSTARPSSARCSHPPPRSRGAARPGLQRPRRRPAAPARGPVPRGAVRAGLLRGVRTGDLVRPGVGLTEVERVVADNDASALTPRCPSSSSRARPTRRCR